MTLQQKNEMIAEFMGYRYYNANGKLDDYYLQRLYDEGKDTERWSTLSLKGNEMFHKSWDWLMLVVEKIEKTNRYDGYYPDTVTMWKNGAIISDGNNGYKLHECLSDTKLNATYEVVCDYIKERLKDKDYEFVTPGVR